MNKSTEPTPSEQQRGQQRVKQDGKPAEPSAARLLRRARSFLNLAAHGTPYNGTSSVKTASKLVADIDEFLSHPPSEGSAAS